MPEDSSFVVPLQHAPDPGPCSSATLLWQAVLSARAAWARERHLPQRGVGANARLALLSALESYVESLDGRGHPVPYALRDELRLLRLTSAASGQAPATPTREELGHGHPVR